MLAPTFLLLAALSTAPVTASGPLILIPSVGHLISQTRLAAVEEAEGAAASQPTDEPAPGDGEAAQPTPEQPTAPAGSLQQARRVAVYALELQGVDINIGTVVTDSLLAEIRKLQAVAAIGMDEIRDMLSHEANKQVLGCESDESCLAEIAGALGVDDLITGKLSKVGDNHVLLVRRIDQRRAKVVGTYTKRLKAESGQEFLLAIGPAVEDLFTDRTLREGQKRGVPDEIALRLDPPPLPTWSFWGVAGGAAAAGVVGMVFGILAKSAEASFHGIANAGTQDSPAPGSQLVSLQGEATSRADAANASFGVAGSLALTAGVMFFFTDWYGYGEAAP